MKYLIIVTILLLVSVSSLFSANLITKDDFSCYVSGSVSLAGEMSNVDVAFYSDNSFIQVIRDWGGSDYFTQFYPNGDVKRSIEKYFPFTGDTSTVSDYNRFSTVSVNESDFSVFPIYTNLSGESNNYIYYMDIQGTAVVAPICFTCDDTLLTGYKKKYSRADIGYSGIIGNVNIYTDTVGNPSIGTNMIVVRFYTPATGVLSDPIVVTDQANPLPNLAGSNDTLYRTNEPVVLKIFQDNSFVVAWQNSYAKQERVYYRVYNNDMTPRTSVLLADCQEGPTGCIGYERVQQFSVANELDGDFYISWVGVDSSDYTHHVWVRGFNADGSPKYNLIRANEHNSLYTNHFASTGYIHQKVVCNNSGELLVTWGQGSAYETASNMYTQKIDALGNLVGHNYRINNNNATILKNIPYACDLSDDGQAVFMWTFLDENNEPQISAQLIPYSQIGVFVPGDINFDMQIDISDLITQVEYMFSNADYKFFPDAVIDFNSDGDLGDISDLVYLVTYMFDGGSPPQSLDPGIRPNPAGN